MSVRRTEYAILGIRVPPSTFEDYDAWEEYYDDPYSRDSLPGLVVLVDDGDTYAIMGKIISKGLDNSEGTPLTTWVIDPDTAVSVGQEVCKKLKIPPQNAAIHILTHWH